MSRLIVGIMAAVVVASMAHTAMAQTRTISSEMRTETGVIEAIEASTRTVVLKKPDGTYVSTVAGPDIKRFSELKVGDKVSARFYENVVLRLKKPGEPEGVSASRTTTPSDQVLPGGTRARQVSITATITAIDMKVPSVTFTGPNGWKYSSKVEDKEALGKVKVGDKVEITWTEAVLVSVEAGK